MGVVPTEWGAVPVDLAMLDRGRCPVCGHPTGDCVGDSHFDHMVEFAPAKKADPAATFTVPRRVYTEEEVNGRKRRRLLYSVGDRIRPEEARDLGLLPS